MCVQRVEDCCPHIDYARGLLSAQGDLLSRAPAVRCPLAGPWMDTAQRGLTVPTLKCEFKSLQVLPCHDCPSWIPSWAPSCSVPPAPASAQVLLGRCHAGEQPLQQGGALTVRCCRAGEIPPGKL